MSRETTGSRVEKELPKKDTTHCLSSTEDRAKALLSCADRTRPSQRSANSLERSAESPRTMQQRWGGASSPLFRAEELRQDGVATQPRYRRSACDRRASSGQAQGPASSCGERRVLSLVGAKIILRPIFVYCRATGSPAQPLANQTGFPPRGMNPLTWVSFRSSSFISALCFYPGCLDPKREPVTAAAAAIAGSQRLETISPKRIVIPYALAAEQAPNPISMLLESTCRARASAAAILLLFRARRANHGTDPPLATSPGHQRLQQRLAVDRIGLGPPMPPVDRDRSRIDDLALASRILVAASPWSP